MLDDRRLGVRKLLQESGADGIGGGAAAVRLRHHSRLFRLDVRRNEGEGVAAEFEATATLQIFRDQSRDVNVTVGGLGKITLNVGKRGRKYFFFFINRVNKSY